MNAIALTFSVLLNEMMALTMYVYASVRNTKDQKLIFKFIIENNVIYYKSKKVPLVTLPKTENDLSQ